MIMKSLFYLLFLLASNQIFSQEIDHATFLRASSMNYSIGLGGDVPFGDMNNRFGPNLGFKLQIEKQTSNNWLFGLQYDYIFGSTVKEDVFENLRLPDGNIYGANNTYATVLQRERGAFLGVNLGKLIPISTKYKSSLKISMSGGVFQHNIRIVDDERSFVQINGEYLKGYDRMTRGFGSKQFVGWEYLAENKRLNFYMGIESTIAFTKSVREYNFDSAGRSDKSGRFDGTIGFRVGFIMPFYGGYEAEEIFY